MSTQVSNFDTAKLPSHITAMFQVADDLTSGVGGGGFPHISIKGKVFHITRGDEKTMITREDGSPASFIDVVLVKANPAVSKVYYEGGYVEGSEAKPVCYSNDGVAPASDAASPQAKKCAVCPHNQWGSRITENNGKGKSCADSRRIAVASPQLVNDPMLIRVPAASLKPLQQYGEALKKRGVAYQAVVTRIGFDYTVAHPALTFKAIDFISQDVANEVVTVMDSEVVKNILGANNSGGVEASVTAPAAPTAAPEPAPNPAPVQEKPAVKKATGFTTATVPSEEPPPAVTPKAAKTPVVEVNSMEDMLASINSIIGTDE